jgi:ABC-type branched-subunit amino acid transport system substrate-binding protein
MRCTFDVGLLFSTDGGYKRLGQAALSGAQQALAEINNDPQLDFFLRAHAVNPQGFLHRYRQGGQALLRDGVRHIFGGTTSAGRKEIMGALERHDALLWYGSPYEGFESSEQVVYLGACPNQTLLPLLRYALEHFGKRGVLLGANSIWGWEYNRIAVEAMNAACAEVVFEHCASLGATQFGDVVAKIVSERPSFILNNLLGDSARAFLRQLDQACQANGLNFPVLSCSLTEAETDAIGDLRSLRLLSCGTFFEDVDLAFCVHQQQLHGDVACSHYYVSSYVAVHLLARALQQLGSDDPVGIRRYLCEHTEDTVLGQLKFSARNGHSSLPCHIAELHQGRFLRLHSEAQPLPASPYLTSNDLGEFYRLRDPAREPHWLRVR